MNTKITLFLVALFVVVGAFFLWMEQHAPPAPPTSDASAFPTEGTPLPAAARVALDQVTGLTLARAGKTMTFARENDHWVQTAPIHAQLNDWSINDVVRMATELRYVEQFTPGASGHPALKDLDLDPAAATLTLRHGDGPALLTVQLGRTTVGSRAYLQIAGDPHVYVVANQLHTQVVDADPFNWRKKNLAAPEPDKVERVVLRQGDAAITLVQRDHDWTFADQHQGRADADAVAKLLGAVKGLYITKFVADNPADPAIYGLDHPTLTLTLTALDAGPAKDANVHDAEPPGLSHVEGFTAGSSATTAPTPTQLAPTPATTQAAPVTYRLSLGSATDLTLQSYFATWSTADSGSVTVFEIPKSDVDKLQIKLDDLRDPRLTLAKARDVRLVRFTQGDQSVAVQWSADHGWSFPAPGSSTDESAAAAPPFAADHFTIEKTLNEWVAARAVSYVTTRPAEPPAASVSLTVEGQAQPELLVLYSGPVLTGAPIKPPTPPAPDDGSPAPKPAPGPTGPSWIVFRNQEATGMVVPQSAVSIPTTALALRDRTVADVAPDALAKVTITLPGQAPVTLERTAPPTTQPTTTPTTAQPTAPGPWTLSTGQTIEPFVLNALLKQIAPLRAKAWLTADAAAPTTQPDRDVITVTWSTFAGQTHHLTLDKVTQQARCDGVSDPFLVTPQFVAAVQENLAHPGAALPALPTEIAPQ